MFCVSLWSRVKRGVSVTIENEPQHAFPVLMCVPPSAEESAHLCPSEGREEAHSRSCGDGMVGVGRHVCLVTCGLGTALLIPQAPDPELTLGSQVQTATWVFLFSFLFF